MPSLRTLLHERPQHMQVIQGMEGFRNYAVRPVL